MNVVKALPALVIEEAEIRRFAAALEDVVARADRMGGAVDAARLGPRPRQRSRAAPVRALVTGAAGFIGSHVVAALAAAGAQVRAFDRRGPAASAGRRRLRRAATCSTATRCAARLTASTPSSTSPRSTATRARDAAAMERINVEGTRTVLEEAGARRVVHTSSCATCGPVAGRAATEADAPAALGAAGALQAHEARRRATRARGRARAARRRHRQPDDTGRARRPPADADRQDGRRRRERARARLPRGQRAQHRRGRGRRARAPARVRARTRRTALPAGRREPLDAGGVRARSARPSAARRRGWPCRGSRPTAPPGWPRGSCASRRCSCSTRCGSRAGRCCFDDARARAELGYSSEPAASALARAARAVAPGGIAQPS